MTANDPRRSDACPGRDELLAFQAGRLADDLLESVADHLAGCPRCARTAESLHDADTLASRLRRARYEPAPDAGCERLAALARGILLDPTGIDPAALETPAAGPATTESAPPRVFAGYQLLERLGRGGMGVVWKARHVRLNRLVALKMIRFIDAAGAQEHDRFRAEAEAVARLAHPNVVEVYDSGEHDGQPYFSMELLEGGDLARRLAGGPFAPRAAAELVRTLALAVQAAHDRNVVHRDLKPANVLFTATGTPKIADFGLAKLLDADAGHTQTGDVLGTASYMAPEQARGDARRIGPLADVYALGAILYELLSGRPPFLAESRQATLEQVRTLEPPPLADAPRELEAICRKCLEKEPSDRYPSAAALAEDLDRWLRRPAKARRFPWLARHAGVARRRSALGALIGGVLVAAVLAVMLAGSPVSTSSPPNTAGTHHSPFALLGAYGGPPWSSWRVGQEESAAAVGRNVPFAIKTRAVALLDLARSPPYTSYRLRALVRHDSSELNGTAGLFLAHRETPCGGGVLHSYIEVSFNDVNDFIAEGEDRRPPGQAKRPKGNPVNLWPRVYSDGKGMPPYDIQMGAIGPPSFTPTGPGGDVWRLLTVEATPERVRSFLDGRQVGELSLRDAEADAELTLSRLRRRNPGARELDSFFPDFPAQGSLGLLVERGSASFRSVEVEQLESGK